MKNIKIIFISVLTLFSFSACDDYLELYPDNEQTLDQYWNTKADIEAVVGAGYYELRESVRHLFIWGEARGNSVDFNGITSEDVQASMELRNLTMTSSNRYLKWERMYKVINMANSVLRYGPVVMVNDKSFTEEEMNGYNAEAYFLRALSYFYLVRTFNEVPYITLPYVDDKVSFELAKSSEEEILGFIKTDLLIALESAKEFYPEKDKNNSPNTKGRATRWSILALLADIYLWEGKYDECIDACNKIINSGNFGLSSNEKWFTNFYPGNTNESIFEIQYDYTKGQTNDFYSWFGTNIFYYPSLYTRQAFTLSTLYGDIRGEGGTYAYPTSVYPTFWKYTGKDFYSVTQAVRGSDEFDQNFIIYRLAEILLMRAEAYIMKGDYETAMSGIAFLREQRSIVEVLNPYSSELEMLEFLYDERIRELSGEGKSWFDLLRIAKRNNYQYREFMISRVLGTISPGMYGVVRSKLNVNGSHYLPIHKDEIASNPLLEQSSYYKSLGF